jgi:hypothetical protein
MNTHIIIPIIEIKDKIKFYKEQIAVSEGSNDMTRAAIETYEMRLLESLIKESKKISLDEKTIEDKAKNMQPIQE